MWEGRRKRGQYLDLLIIAVLLTLFNRSSPFSPLPASYLLPPFPAPPAARLVPFLASCTFSSGLNPNAPTLPRSIASATERDEAIRRATGSRKGLWEGERAEAKGEGEAMRVGEEKRAEAGAGGEEASGGEEGAAGGGGDIGVFSSATATDAGVAGAASVGTAAATPPLPAFAASIFCCSFESFFSG